MTEKLYTDHTKSCDYPNPDEWVSGHIIVMWDGKWWGTYYNLDDAARHCNQKLKNPDNCFTYDDDVLALEFLEIIDAPPFSTLHIFKRKNERGERVSFGHVVKELGNPLTDKII